MGYVRDKKYKLIFEDPEFTGLEVVARPLPTGDYLEMVALMDEPAETIRDSKDKHHRIYEIFVTALISWNLEKEDGAPVPATVDGLGGQDHEFCLELIRAYMDAVTGVPAPLELRSPSGDPSLEASIPMETLSPSRSS